MAIRRNNFDLLRLVAAAQVAFFHSGHHLSVPLDQANPIVRFFNELPGVPIFFVISGFLISLSWERNSDLASYTRNRLLRIYPALWVCLAVGIATAAWFGGVDFLRLEAIPWLVAQITIGQFYNPDFLRSYGLGVLNGSLWTIPVELQFYAFVPLMYWLLRLRERPATPALLAIAIASAGMQAAFVALGGAQSEAIPAKLFTVSLAPHLWMFMIGVLMQRHFDRIGPWLEGKAVWWLALYALLVMTEDAIGWQVGSNTPNPVPMLVLAGLAVSCSYTAPATAERLLGRNDVSYGLYIYHAVVLNVFVATGNTGSWSSLGAVLAVSLAAAVFSWLAVERPALQRKRNPAHPIARGGA